jgi:DNA-binding MarR family transcriptional regulator
MKKRNIHARMPERDELRENPVKLCHEISHLSRNILRASRDNDDVMSSHGTRLVISYLAIGYGITQLDLVNATHLRAPTISVILKNLEAEGLVERKRDKDDLRILRVYLTEKGRDVDRNNIERVKATDTRALLGISEDEAEELMRLLKKIRDNLLENTEGNTEQ